MALPWLKRTNHTWCSSPSLFPFFLKVKGNRESYGDSSRREEWLYLNIPDVPWSWPYVCFSLKSVASSSYLSFCPIRVEISLVLSSYSIISYLFWKLKSSLILLYSWKITNSSCFHKMQPSRFRCAVSVYSFDTSLCFHYHSIWVIDLLLAYDRSFAVDLELSCETLLNGFLEHKTE